MDGEDAAEEEWVPTPLQPKLISLRDHPRYSAGEIKAFEAIMKLERGFRGIAHPDRCVKVLIHMC